MASALANLRNAPRVNAVLNERPDIAQTHFVDHRVDHDPRGAGGLYAIANYIDCFDMSAKAGPRLLQRNVALETRTMPFGSHVPL
ncbi:MAG: hypothetical protein ACR2PI_00280 [Hyphomicrobiaceae bacterium]